MRISLRQAELLAKYTHARANSACYQVDGNWVLGCCNNTGKVETWCAMKIQKRLMQQNCEKNCVLPFILLSCPWNLLTITATIHRTFYFGKKNYMENQIFQILCSMQDYAVLVSKITLSGQWGLKTSDGLMNES